MLTLITTLVGALLGFVPQLLNIWKDKGDKAHELKLIDLQLKQAELGHSFKMAEINTQADIAESTAIYKTYKVGINWVDAFAGTVRPVITYAFFGLYAFVKAIVIIYSLQHMPAPDAPVFLLKDALAFVWNPEDSAMLGGILGFWFGSRGFEKARVASYRKN